MAWRENRFLTWVFVTSQRHKALSISDILLTPNAKYTPRLRRRRGRERLAERGGVGGTAGGKGVCLRLPLRLPHQLAERGQGGQLAVGKIIFKFMKSIIAPLGITRKGASALRMRYLFIQIVFYIIVIYLFQKFFSSFFCEVKIGTTMRPFRKRCKLG